MHSKRGMITVFIIMGVIILVAVVFVLAVRSEFFKATFMPSEDSVIPVQKYVEECVEKVSKFALYRMGMQGGYLMLPDDYFNNGVFNVGYAYNDGKTFLSLDEMEQQLESFILINMPNCLNNFREFRNEGFGIQEGQMNVDVLFAKTDMIVTLNMPLAVTKGEFHAKLEKFPVPVKVAAKEIHSGVDMFAGFDRMYNMNHLNSLNANVSVNAFGETDLFAEQNFDSVIGGMNYIFLYSING